jgi:hypothetical protein
MFKRKKKSKKKHNSKFLFLAILGVTFMPNLSLFCMDGDISLDELAADIGIDLSGGDEPDRIGEALKTKMPKMPEKITDLSFWKRTHGARTRDPLFLIPTRPLIFSKNGITATAFFNRSSRLPVYPGVVFNLASLGVLESMTNMSGQFSSSEIGSFDTLFKTLPYIRKMSVQEHRLGIMLNGGFSWNRLSFQMTLPLIFAERNYWLSTKNEREGLLKILETLGTDSKGGAYKTTFGLGDTKLRMAYNVAKNDRIKSAIGISVTAPTSKLFEKKPGKIIKSTAGASRNGLIGDLLAVGKHILINPKLGTGHWGVGGFWEFDVALVQDKLNFWGRLSYDHLLAGREERFMPSNKMISQDAFIDLALSGDTISEDFPVADLFPVLTSVSVSPGDIYNATLGLNWKLNKKWNMQFGYDFYMQGAEKINKIRCYISSCSPT